MSDNDFLQETPARYLRCCADAMRWMLARPPLRGGFLNTKCNSLTRADYAAADGTRGPDFVYGWIQGRGLEAVVTHAAQLADTEPQLAASLDQLGKKLYQCLNLVRKADGHVRFCYRAGADGNLQPVSVRSDGSWDEQQIAVSEYGYADIFAAKGLIAAAARYFPSDLDQQLDYLRQIDAAIGEGRFSSDERLLPDAAPPDDYGPRMIMLGAGEMLHSCNLDEAHAEFATKYVAHVLDRHYDEASGVLRNVPAHDKCNFGHAIEFVGFALAYQSVRRNQRQLEQLARILRIAFAKGFTGTGVALAVSADSGVILNPLCPWWSLPEAIRAAARCYALTGDAADLEIWRAADEAFFKHYWQDDIGFALQSRDANGPVDFVPATPDLDPGYHTGLSLLAAATVAQKLAMSTGQARKQATVT